MKHPRILVLVHPDLVPPDDPTEHEMTKAAWKMEYDVVVTLRGMGHEIRILGVGNELRPIRDLAEEFKPDIVFNLVEGFDDIRALDANVVSYLELLGIAHTGCNPRGLILSRDKALSKKLLAYHRIPFPRFAVFPRHRAVKRPQRLEFPLMVKTLDQDASLGISQASVVQDDGELLERVRFVHDSLGAAAIAEEYIEGRELYVGVVGNSRLRAFPVWELRMDKLPPEGRLIATERVKFNTKYQEKYGINWGPAADLDAAMSERLQALAKRVYRALELSGYARIDFRLDATGRPFVLEANANPDIGYGGELPESAHLAGVGYAQLLKRIISLGLAWREQTRA